MFPTSAPKRSRSPSPSPSHSSKQPKLANPTLPVKFLILSDTHDAIPPLAPCDVLLHCGDLTEDGSPSSLSKALKAIGKADAEPKLVIAGNHEICLDEAYYLSEGGSKEACDEASSMIARTPDSEASQNGVVFLSEGTHTFTLKSGATFTIYASPYTPRYSASAFQYDSAEDRFNLSGSTPDWARNIGTETSIVPDSVNIMMTHGPPKYLLDRTAGDASAGCEHPRRALARVRPRLHCFGHVHSGYGAVRVGYDDEKMEDGEDCLNVITKEWVGKNQAKRRGYAALSPGSVEAFKEDEGQTLLINAAVEAGEGGGEGAVDSRIRDKKGEHCIM